MTVTLDQYEEAERELGMREARVGFLVHAMVSLVVWAVLVPVNIFVADGFPWSAFVVGGMSIGLLFHWVGYRRAELDMRSRQHKIEAHAAGGVTCR
jgi:hypothetical protein